MQVIPKYRGQWRWMLLGAAAGAAAVTFAAHKGVNLPGGAA